MTDKTDEERVSIWSTGDTERTWLILLASVFFYPSLILIVWHNWHKIVEYDYNTIIDVITTTGSAGLFAVTLAFFLIEGVNLMIVPVEKIRNKIRTQTEEYLAKRFKEGQQEGRRERDVQWTEWLERVKTQHPELPSPPFIQDETGQNGSASNNE